MKQYLQYLALGFVAIFGIGAFVLAMEWASNRGKPEVIVIQKSLISTNVYPDKVCVTYFDPVNKPTVAMECASPSNAQKDK